MWETWWGSNLCRSKPAVYIVSLKFVCRYFKQIEKQLTAKVELNTQNDSYLKSLLLIYMSKNIQATAKTPGDIAERFKESFLVTWQLLFNLYIVVKARMFCFLLFCFVHPGLIFLVLYQTRRYDKFFSLMAILVILGKGHWLVINLKYTITKKYCNFFFHKIWVTSCTTYPTHNTHNQKVPYLHICSFLYKS